LSGTLKTALVTGAGSGIGRGIAKTLDALGLRLALIGRDESKLGQTRAELSQGRDSTLIFSCDVADRDSVNSTVEQVQESARVDRHIDLQCRHERPSQESGITFARRLGQDDRREPDGLVQTWFTTCCLPCAPGKTA